MLMTPHVDPLYEDLVPITVITLWMVNTDPLIGMHETLVHLGVIPLVIMIITSRGELTIRHLVWVITHLSSPTAGSALQLCFATRLQRGRIHGMLDGLIHRLGMWIVLLRLEHAGIYPPSVVPIGEARLLLVVVQVFHLNDVIRVGITPPS